VRPLIVACLLAVAGCTAGSHAAALPAGQATVVRVTDGDTIVVHLAAGDESIRLIGVDTPEEVKPDTPVECFAREAAARTAALLPVGTVVRLERDKEARDRYGRLLAYVTRMTDGLSVEADLLRGGYATTLAISPNTTHAGDYEALVNAARTAGIGLWGACGGPHVVK
jgi:micrococcal nuclease